MAEQERIPVIDIFAGPGGLGEGFSAFHDKGIHPFKIALSVEKDASARETLMFRSFFRQFPQADLQPNHKNATDKDLIFDDRFRVQLAGSVATTVTSHLSKDGHYFIHYDPAQCRSMTVREVARLQTFPSDWIANTISTL